MPPRGSGGSTLDNLSAQRRRLARTRAEIFSSGSVGSLTPGRAAPPPPSPTPQAGQPASAPSAEVAAAPVADQATARDQMLTKVQGFLEQQRTGGATPAPGPVQAVSAEGNPAGLQQQLNDLQAARLSPEVQFYRVAGRPGSPREIAAFSTRLQLEQQLGRPPTRGEIATALTSADTFNPTSPVAFEG